MFATVKLRTKKTKGSRSRAVCLAMAFRLATAAQKRWRALNGAEFDPIQKRLLRSARWTVTPLADMFWLALRFRPRFPRRRETAFLDGIELVSEVAKGTKFVDGVRAAA